LTGTPIQNVLDDLGALVRFLQVPLLEANSSFRTYIVQPVESGRSVGFSNLRLLLSSICLRRTNDLLQLPGATTLLHRLELSEIESTEYDRIEEVFRREIDKAVSGRKPAEAYNGILQALLRLRLLCSHGTYELALQDCKRGLPSDPDKALSLLQQSDEAICAYCSCDVALVGKPNDPESGALTVCSHLLCGDCLPQYEVDLKESRKGSKAQCPLCYQMIGLNFVELKKVGRGQILGSHSPLTLRAMNYFDTTEGYSSKLCVLLQDLESHMHKNKR